MWRRKREEQPDERPPVKRPHGIYSATREEWSKIGPESFPISTFICIEDEARLYFTGAKQGLTFEEGERQWWRVKLEAGDE